jgi:hypothetical protein
VQVEQQLQNCTSDRKAAESEKRTLLEVILCSLSSMLESYSLYNNMKGINKLHVGWVLPTLPVTAVHGLTFYIDLHHC